MAEIQFIEANPGCVLQFASDVPNKVPFHCPAAVASLAPKEVPDSLLIFLMSKTTLNPAPWTVQGFELTTPMPVQVRLTPTGGAGTCWVRVRVAVGLEDTPWHDAVTVNTGSADPGKALPKSITPSPPKPGCWLGHLELPTGPLPGVLATKFQSSD